MTLKIARIQYTQLGTGGSPNGNMPKPPQPIMAETNCGVVQCPAVENTHWMFDPGWQT